MLVGTITAFDMQTLTIQVPFTDVNMLDKQRCKEADIRLIDGRHISTEQRRKSYALLRDICLHTGYDTEQLKDIMKCEYIARTGIPEFSLSDCEMTVARGFIDFLVEFCLEWDIPCQDALLDYAQDIARYLYLCLYHKKCCICGVDKTDLHHCDTVGIGRNRKEICHIGYRAMSLCRKHHNEAHAKGQIVFENLYHVFGVEIDDAMAKRHKLGKGATI